MVMRLPQPNTCSLRLIDDVVVERQGGTNSAFFTSIEDEWKEKVQEYLDEGGSPEVVKPWPRIAPKKKTFLNLYGSPKDDAVQKIAIDNLRNHELPLCPACGELGKPNTLDHYLPKSEYPHFCITPLNLFPMCDACQSEKGTKTGDNQNPRFFIHPYFDIFVAEQAIELSIDPPFDAPTFNLGPHTQLTPDQSTLVICHVRELAIEQRYGHFFREQHKRLIRLVAYMRNKGQNVSATLESFCFEKQIPTKNSWDHVFYAAVLANDNMMDYLENKELPQFP